MKLTEDEVILLLNDYLKKNGWKIESYCLGQKHGKDIVAIRNNITLIVEAKGAKANDKSPTKKREEFDTGQLKNHFGKAIVKIFDEMYKNKNAKFAIAHPDDFEIRKSIGHLTPFLKSLGIIHYWVSENGIIIDE